MEIIKSVAGCSSGQPAEQATEATPISLESWFEPFRRNIAGSEHTFETPYGTQRIVYADWIASGRIYNPIEELIQREIAPFVGFPEPAWGGADLRIRRSGGGGASSRWLIPSGRGSTLRLSFEGFPRDVFDTV